MSGADNSPEEIIVDPLFAGLTRPATMWGIPLTAFVFEFMATVLIFLAVGKPLYLLLGVPIHGVLYLLSANDPGKFDAAWIWLITFGRCLNRKHWEGASFSPLSKDRFTE
jgi:type IV secretion system protein VirB3